ncbi:MAG: FkbM family methyltransferase [Rhodospirillaceae bacterium]
MMKQAVTRIADALGYAVIPRWRLPRFEMARKLRDLFDRHAIETVIDVGANEGQYRDFLRDEVGFEGAIVSFEPIPDLARLLETRARTDPRWTISQKALGAARGTATINVMAGSDFSSFLQPRQVENHRQNEKNTVVRAVAVEVSTLDDEIPADRSLARTYLKLDTQGFDLEVLKGARRAIAQVPALQTEVSFRPFYKGMPTYGESLDAFKNSGFAVAAFFLVTDDGHHRAAEFDCVMVRDS